MTLWRDSGLAFLLFLAVLDTIELHVVWGAMFGGFVFFTTALLVFFFFGGRGGRGAGGPGGVGLHMVGINDGFFHGRIGGRRYLRLLRWTCQ